MQRSPDLRFVLMIAAGALIVLLGLVIVWQSGASGERRTDSTVASKKAADQASTLPKKGTPDNSTIDRNAKITEAQRGDYAKLMRSALHIADPKKRQGVVTALALKWMNDDLRSFIAFLDEVDAQELTDRRTWGILAPALMEALPKVGDRTALSSYLNEVVQRLILFNATRDPEGMLKWAQEWLDGDFLQFALATLAPNLFTNNPTAAWEAFAQITSPLYRTQTIEELSGLWAQTEPDKAIAWVKQLPTRYERARGMNRALMALAETQPAEAAEQLSSFSSNAQSDYQSTVQAEMAANGISPTDPQADPNTEEGREGGAAAPLMNPDLESLQEAAAMIGHKLAAADPATAISTANALSDPRLKAQLLQSALVSWSQQDPVAATEYYLSSGLGNATASSMFEIWATQNPTAAATRAATVTDTAMRQQALDGAVTGWNSSVNSSAIGKWINTLPNAADRDVANASLVNSLTASKPADAFTRALQINNTSLREQALLSAYTRLAATHPSLAQTLMNQSKLTSSDLASIQKVNRAISTSVR